ncbi:hypothetical protein IP91_01360 [Pseudoduganella lurida]|uniref:DUF4105 domain-containing protein n=1 Tax=Pseudoduganella lurida TaxID=1036180 RepID=A0A562RPJ0_9BURK|nr:hypothetical protein [Pseudoduganella lurida]TWI70276.1 hypothetical protein IP91_01360 [Pseudoduganella lurida]
MLEINFKKSGPAKLPFFIVYRDWGLSMLGKFLAAAAAFVAFISTDCVAEAAAGKAPAGLKGALEQEAIGLLPADGMRLVSGKCRDCRMLKQGLWYFETEAIAVPRDGVPVSGYTNGVDRQADVANWAAASGGEKLAYPMLAWIGAPAIFEHAAMLPSGTRVQTADQTELDIRLAPRLATNRSYANEATAAFFSGREVRMRGAIDSSSGNDVFVARTIWPADFAFDPARLAARPLQSPADLAAFVRAPVKPARGIETRLLWERHPGQPRNWQRKPVLGFLLNGAQGDDDESLGGHFAVATGRIGVHGEWFDWAVNNFYNLDAVSEKGIVAATLPMDNYLMDLNSGQQYYRPSTMLVAVLNHERTAAAFQGGVQRVFNHLYRHDFQYRHATANCAGISLDVFDALGWRIPRRGPTAPLKSLGAYAYIAAKDVSLQSGRRIYDYLNEEQTRLLPAVAFEAAGLDLLSMVGASGTGRPLSGYERLLAGDVEAIFLVRIPQVPSSRATGSAPVFSFDEFRARVPADQADWKTVPAAVRPFPAALRDARSVPEQEPSPVPLPIAVIVAGIGLAGWLFWRRRAAPRAVSKQPAPQPEEMTQ